LFDAAVARAAELLRAGQLVALPTETVYGLAANAFDPPAVRRIYEAKGRPAHNPLIVHVSSLAMARRCVGDWPEVARALARAFWPGPLTLVLPKADVIPGIVTAGGGTVGVRWPGHPVTQAVIRACGFPLAAPSANRSTQVSPTTARHVVAALRGRVGLVVDGGPCAVGIESTVLDLTVSPPRVLRPGMIHEESLQAVLGECGTRSAERGTQRKNGRRTATRGNAGGTLRADGRVSSPASTTELRSPGLLPKHYSPRARLVLLRWASDAELHSQLKKLGVRPGSAHLVAHTRIPSRERFEHVSLIPHDPEAFARALYAELHRCDEEGARLIVVEALPDTPEWRAITDRLRRAAA
jgi:L-threonylcarbamoyladenylate synthase